MLCFDLDLVSAILGVVSDKQVERFNRNISYWKGIIKRNGIQKCRHAITEDSQ